MLKVIKYEFYPEKILIEKTKEQAQVGDTSVWDKTKPDYDKLKYRSMPLPLPASFRAMSAVSTAGHVDVYVTIDTAYPPGASYDIIAVRTDEGIGDNRYQFVDTIRMTDGSGVFHIFYRAISFD